jgi:hypothetical protein
MLISYVRIELQLKHCDTGLYTCSVNHQVKVLTNIKFGGILAKPPQSCAPKMTVKGAAKKK